MNTCALFLAVLICAPLSLASRASAATGSCPAGARAAGRPPPEGFEVWCEVEDARSGEWIKNGPWTAWYQSGQVRAEGEYRDGLRDGAWTIWNPAGEPIAELEYRRGVLASRKMFARAIEPARVLPEQPKQVATSSLSAQSSAVARVAPIPDGPQDNSRASGLAETALVLDPDPRAPPDSRDPPDPQDSGQAPPPSQGKVSAVAPPRTAPDDFWSSFTADSDLYRYELGIITRLYIPLPYFAVRFAPSWWVGVSTEYLYGDLRGDPIADFCAPSDVVCAPDGAPEPKRRDAVPYTFMGGSVFVRGVFVLSNGIFGVMVSARAAGGVADFELPKADATLLAVVEADVLLFNEHFILLGGSFGAGYNLTIGYPMLSYDFRTLGVRFTF